MPYRTTFSPARDQILLNGLKGAIAGAVGVWVMDRLDWFLFKNESPAARRRSEQVRPDGLDPAHVAASRAAETIGLPLSRAQPNAAGIGIHYALGIGPGALYGALRERLPAGVAGQDHMYGLGLGLGLFLVQDEGMNAISGLSADQRRYPWQAHARGLAAHLALGLVTNTVLNLLQAPRPASGGARALRDARGVGDRSGPGAMSGAGNTRDALAPANHSGSRAHFSPLATGGAGNIDISGIGDRRETSPLSAGTTGAGPH